MAAEPQTSASAIGQLIAAYGLAVCFGAPVLVGVTSHMDRRTLLVAALTVLRFLTGFGAAILTPQSPATAGSLAPPAQGGSAIALVCDPGVAAAAGHGTWRRS